MPSVIRPRLLLEGADGVLDGDVERVVVVGTGDRREQVHPGQDGPDLGDVRTGVTAAEYPHALLALPGHRAGLGAWQENLRWDGPRSSIVPCQLSVTAQAR